MPWNPGLEQYSPPGAPGGESPGPGGPVLALGPNKSQFRRPRGLSRNRSSPPKLLY
jgi:hypothetical protein